MLSLKSRRRKSKSPSTGGGRRPRVGEAFAGRAIEFAPTFELLEERVLLSVTQFSDLVFPTFVGNRTDLALDFPGGQLVTSAPRRDVAVFDTVDGEPIPGFETVRFTSQNVLITQQTTGVPDLEPNDTLATAQFIPLGLDSGEFDNVLVSGDLSSATDVDFFTFNARQGDVLLSTIGLIDANLTLFDLGADGAPGGGDDQQILTTINDSDRFLELTITGLTGASLANPQSVPLGSETRLPGDRTYAFRVQPGQTGNYVLDLRVARPATETLDMVQEFFLDFNGASGLDFSGVGLGASLNIPALDLTAMGFSPGQRDQFIDQVVQFVTADFEQVRAANINNPDYDFRVTTSRDAPDPAGSLNAMRVAIGGSAFDAGLPLGVIGVADDIDTGNQSLTNNVLVFPEDIAQFNPTGSLASIAREVADTVTHEIGHGIGLWHTDPNTPGEIMDPIAPPPGTLIQFTVDSYRGTEVFAGVQDVIGSVAFNLTGPTAPPVPADLPPTVVDMQLQELSVIVTFSEPVSNVNASTFLLDRSGFDGTFADGNEISFNPVSISSDVTDTVWIFTADPTSSLLPDTYRVTLTDSIVDVDGPTIDPLDGEFTGIFPSGNGTAGGDFVNTFQVTDRSARIFLELTDASDTGIKGDRTTNQATPTLKGMILDAFPSLTRNRPVGVRVDIFADFAGPLGNADFAISGVTTDDNSEFQFQIPAGNPLPEGVHRVELTFTDLNGNVSTLSRGIRVDLTAPVVTAVDVGGLDIFPLGPTPLSPAFSEITVVIDDPPIAGVNLGLDPSTASLPTNYQLIASGNGTFGDGDDLDLSNAISSIDVVFDPFTSSATTLTLSVENSLLVDDLYQFVVKGTTTVTDAAGNAVDGDANGTPGPDFVRQFELDVTSPRVLATNPDPRTIFETGGLDPQDDTFGLSATPDLAGLGGHITGSNLEIEMSFFDPVFAPSTNPLNGLFGFIDFDTDQNQATGIAGHQETLGPSINAALGVDFYIDLGSEKAHSGLVDVVHAVSGLVMGTAPITYTGTAVAITAPLALFGAAGPFNMGAIVGLDLNLNNVLSATETTDEILNAAAVTSVAAPAPSVTPTAVQIQSGFPGMDFSDSGGNTFPSTNAAVGTLGHVVEVINSTVGIFNTAGTQLFQQDLRTFFTQVDPEMDPTEPRVVFDEIAERFVIAALEQDIAGNSSFLLLAISDDANPTGVGPTNWEMHRLDIVDPGIDLGNDVESTDFRGDFPGLAYDADAVFVTLNMIGFPSTDPDTPNVGFDHVSVITVDKTTVLDEDDTTITFTDSDLDGSHRNLRPAIMHGAVSGDPMYFVSEAGFASGTDIRVVRMTNKLAAVPTFTGFDVTVPIYDPFFSSAPQPGATGNIDNGDSRLLNAAFRGDRLVTAQTVANAGNESTVRWYEFDVSVVVPTLTQSGGVDPGPSIHVYYPTIEIAASGDLGMTFMQSSAFEFMSMYVTGQDFGDPAGFMHPPQLARGGDAIFSGADFPPFGAGDVSSIAVDPVTDTFWAANEYATIDLFNNWGTWISNFIVEGGQVITSADARLGPDIVTLTVGFDSSLPIVAPSVDALNGLYGFIDLETSLATGAVNPGTGNAGVDFFLDLGSEIAHPGFVDVVDNRFGPVVIGQAAIVYSSNGIQISLPRNLLAGLGTGFSYAVVAEDSTATEIDRTDFNPSVAVGAPSVGDPTGDLFNTPGFPFAPPDLTGSDVAINGDLGFITLALDFDSSISAPSTSPLPDNRVFGFIDVDLDRNVTTGNTTNAPLSGVPGTGMAGAELVVDLGSESLHPGFVDIINASTGIVAFQAPIAYGTRGLQFTLSRDTLNAAGFVIGGGAVVEIEPNNAISTAQNLDGAFSLDFDPNIGDTIGNTSTTIPHVTIQGTGDGTFDYYSFTVANLGDRAIFDIDFGSGGVGSIDTELFLYDQNGNLLASNDDFSTTAGAGGSTSSLDAFLQFVFAAPGTYIIGVGEFNSVGSPGGITGNAPDAGDTYTLQVSLQNAISRVDYRAAVGTSAALTDEIANHQTILARQTLADFAPNEFVITFTEDLGVVNSGMVEMTGSSDGIWGNGNDVVIPGTIAFAPGRTDQIVFTPDVSSLPLAPDYYRIRVLSGMTEDLAGNLLDGEPLGFDDGAGAFEVFFNDGRRLPGLSGDGLTGGNYISSFIVAGPGDILFSQADFEDDPLLAFDDPVGDLARPFPTLQRAMGADPAFSDPDSVAAQRAAGEAGPIVVWALESFDGETPFVVASPPGSGVDATLDVPDFTALVFDSGSITKLQNANLDVSGAGSVLQVIGLPTLAATFTSFKDDSIGGDTNGDGDNGVPFGGDWGGMVLRDGSDDLLSIVNFGEIRFGGGPVPGALGERFDPIFLEAARTTITNSSVSQSRSGQAAISANVDSFLEDELARGPLVRDNTLTNNSINGIWVRPESGTGVAMATEALPADSMFTFDDPTPYVLTSLMHVGEQFLPSANVDRGETTRVFVSNRFNFDPGIIFKMQIAAGIEVLSATTRIGSVLGPEAGTINVGDRRFLDTYDFSTGPTNPAISGNSRVIFTSFLDDTALTGTDVDNDGVIDLVYTAANDTNNDQGATLPSAGAWGGIRIDGRTTSVIDEADFRFGGGNNLRLDGNNARSPLHYETGFFVVSTGSTDGDIIGGSTVFSAVTNNNFTNSARSGISANPDVLQAGDPTNPLASGNPFFRGNVFERNVINGLEVRTYINTFGDPLGDWDINFFLRSLGEDPATEKLNLTVDSVWDDTDLVHVLRGPIIAVGDLPLFTLFNVQVNFEENEIFIFDDPVTTEPQPSQTFTMKSNAPGTQLANFERIDKPGESLVVKLWNGGLPDAPELGDTYTDTDQVGAGFWFGYDDGVDSLPADPILDQGLNSQLRIIGIRGNEFLNQEPVPVIITSLLDDTAGTVVRGVAQFDTNNDGDGSLPQPGDGGVILIGGLTLTDYDLIDPTNGNLIDTADIRYLRRVEVVGGSLQDIDNVGGGFDADGNPLPQDDDITPGDLPVPTNLITDQRRGAFANTTQAMTIANSTFSNMGDMGVGLSAPFRLLARNIGPGDTGDNEWLLQRVNAVAVPAEVFFVNNVFANNPIGVQINADIDTGEDCPGGATHILNCGLFTDMRNHSVLLHNSFVSNETGLLIDDPIPGLPIIPLGGARVPVVAMVMNNIFAFHSVVGLDHRSPDDTTFIIDDVDQSGSVQFNLFFGNAADGVPDGATGAPFVGENPVFGDPRFVDVAGGDFRLRAGSAATDASLSELGPGLPGDFLKQVFTDDGVRTFGRSGPFAGLGGVAEPDELVTLPTQSWVPAGLTDPDVLPTNGSLNIPSNPAFNPGIDTGVFLFSNLGPTEIGGQRDIFGFQRQDAPEQPNVGFGRHPFFDIGAVEFRQLNPPVVTDFVINRDAANNPTALVATFSEDLDPNSVFFAGLNGTFIVIGSGGDGTFGDGNEFVVSPSSPLTFAPIPNEATFSLAGQVLPSDRYRVRLKGSGSPVMVDLDGVRLDGEFAGTFPSGDGFPGGDFLLEFSVDADPAAIVLFSLADQSDSNINEPPGREITNVNVPSFVGTVTDLFPGSVVGLLVELDLEGDGAFDDGQGLTDAQGNFIVTANKILLDSDDPANPGFANGTIVVDPTTGALFNEMRVRVTDDGFNQTIASTLVRIDTKDPSVVAATPAATIPPTVFRQTLTSVDITFGDGDGPVEDMNDALFNNTNVVLVASGNDGNFNSGNEVVIVPTGFSFDFPSSTLSIQVGALLNDFYQLTLLSPPVSDLAGNVLDGEFTGTLPSGDGIAGGNFVYEFVLADPNNAVDLLVDINSPTAPTEDGLSLPTAFDTIQEAIDVARPGDRVVVLDGTYDENIVLRSVVDVVADRPGLGVVTDLDGPDASGNFNPVPVPGGGDVDADGLFGAQRTLIQPAAGNAVDASNTFGASIQGFGIIALGGIGVLSNDSDVLVDGNIVAQNQVGIQVDEIAGGVLPTIQNNLIWSNLGNGVQFGTGVVGNNGAGLGADVINNTFVFNSGEGIRIDTTFVGVLNIQNNVFGSNTGASDINRGTTTPTIEFNLFAPASSPPFVLPGGFTLSSTNKIVANPQFVFPVVLGTTFDQLLFLQANFVPQTGSPMIDAANGSVAPALDLRGFTRFDDPAVPNTGAGSPTFVDIGAFERGGTLPAGGSGGSGPTASLDSVGLFDPVSSTFFLNPSNESGSANPAFRYGPADAGWLPVTGDWDGDGVSTAGLFDPVHGTFFLRNVNAPGIADTVARFGPAGSGWLPIAGDWDGDGDDTIGLFDPVSSTFFLKNSNTPGTADETFRFGPRGTGWEPVLGDWNGDGTDSVGLFDLVSSTFFLKDGHSPGPADLTVRFGPKNAGWEPVIGDWNQDGTDTIGLHDPVQSVFYLNDTNAPGVADMTFRFGPVGSGWMPLSGDWDGILSSSESSSSASSTTTFSYAAATTGLAGDSQTSDDDSIEAVGLLSASVHEAAFTSSGSDDDGDAAAADELASLGESADSENDDSLDAALLELVDEWSLTGLSDPLN